MEFHIHSFTHHVTIICERNLMTNDIGVRFSHLNDFDTIREINKIYIALFRTGIEIKVHPYGGDTCEIRNNQSNSIHNKSFVLKTFCNQSYRRADYYLPFWCIIPNNKFKLHIKPNNHHYSYRH